jgi:hypothetical protein
MKKGTGIPIGNVNNKGNLPKEGFSIAVCGIHRQLLVFPQKEWHNQFTSPFYQFENDVVGRM